MTASLMICGTSFSNCSLEYQMHATIYRRVGMLVEVSGPLKTWVRRSGMH